VILDHTFKSFLKNHNNLIDIQMIKKDTSRKGVKFVIRYGKELDQ